jgi:hypothetical protein
MQGVQVEALMEENWSLVRLLDWGEWEYDELLARGQYRVLGPKQGFFGSDFASEDVCCVRVGPSFGVLWRSCLLCAPAMFSLFFFW